LRPMRRVIRVVELSDHGLRRGGIAVDKGLDKGPGKAVGILAIALVFQAGHGGGTGQRLRVIERSAVEAERKERVMPEAVGIIAIGIARGDLLHPLGDEVTQGMIDRGRMARVMESSGQTRGEADLAINAAQEEDTKVRRQGAALKIGTDSRAGHGRNTPLCWSRIGHRQTFCGPYGRGFAQTLCYQRLGEGLPFFMNNSG
jgi:hypothetical protein